VGSNPFNYYFSNKTINVYLTNALLIILITNVLKIKRLICSRCQQILLIITMIIMSNDGEEGDKWLFRFYVQFTITCLQIIVFIILITINYLLLLLHYIILLNSFYCLSI